MAEEVIAEEATKTSDEEEPEDSEDESTVNSVDRTELEQVLAWIGYDTDEEVAALADELASLKEFCNYSYKEIAAMVKDGVTYKSNNKTVKLKFPMSIQLSLKKMIDWAQDKKKVGESATLDGITNRASFMKAINLARERKVIRDKEKDAHEAQIKAASPGKLKDSKMWDEWLTGLQTMLTLMRGVTDVPLIYVVRQEPTPKPGDTFESFDEECIAKAPLSGPAFQADARSVHMVIKSLVVGEHAEQWMKGGYTKKNGREDLTKLSAHFQGKGNSSRSIHDAERLLATLHYKNERAMSFENFVSKAQAMWNMFHINGEEKSTSAQVRWLLNSVNDPTLVATIASLNVDVEKDPDDWDFDTCANHIASQIRKYANVDKAKKVAVVQTKSGSGRHGAYKDGEVYTGTYTKDEWQALSSDEKGLVIKARSGKKSPKGKQVKKFQTLTKKIQNQKKEIAALKKRNNTSDEPESDSEKDEPMNDAGNSFGGRAGKANSKKQKRSD